MKLPKFATDRFWDGFTDLCPKWPLMTRPLGPGTLVYGRVGAALVSGGAFEFAKDQSVRGINEQYQRCDHATK